MASTALATPALARDDQWYVELDGGVMLVEDLDLELEGADNVQSLDLDKGYDFGGIVGYDFGGFRLEAEASYREADIGRVPVGNVSKNPASSCCWHHSHIHAATVLPLPLWPMRTDCRCCCFVATRS